MNLLKRVYKILRSVKLALVLIAYIGITAGIATIIPQGRDLSFYNETYPGFLSWLIAALDFNRYFSSVFFLVPAVLFFINLSVCTFHRIFTRLKGNVKKRFGPDIIHIGLLLLMVGGLITLSGRQENLFYLGDGDSITLPGGDYSLQLKSFKYLTYDNGRPKQWISAVNLKKDGEIVKEFSIEVNKPLKIGNLKIYQYTYKDNSDVLIMDAAGNTGYLFPGYYIRNGDETIVFNSVNVSYKDETSAQLKMGSETAIFEKWIGNKKVGTYKIPVDGTIDGFRVSKIQQKMLTGLKAVDDPGVVPVIIAFILICFGLILTFSQKIGDDKL